MSALLDVILPVFVVLASGYILTWRGYFNDAANNGLMKFAQGFALPLLLFRSISDLDLGDNFIAPRPQRDMKTVARHRLSQRRAIGPGADNADPLDFPVFHGFSFIFPLLRPRACFAPEAASAGRTIRQILDRCLTLHPAFADSVLRSFSLGEPPDRTPTGASPLREEGDLWPVG